MCHKRHAALHAYLLELEHAYHSGYDANRISIPYLSNIRQQIGVLLFRFYTVAQTS